MRGKSHAALGLFLLREYMPGISRTAAKAFLIGCIQPDRNPTTYLKGSLRSRWMRGHNYSNASRFLFRLAARLERKRDFTVWDFYSLGKLVHYTMDSFTYAHNEHFPKDLASHRYYEVSLQIFFLRHFRSCQKPSQQLDVPCADIVRRMHENYMHLPGAVETDLAYAFSACCQLVWKLTENIRESQANQFHYSKKDDILVP